MKEMQETQVRSLSWEDPLEEGMETHSSILARRMPWTEEPGWLQSTGSRRVGHDWATNPHERTDFFPSVIVNGYIDICTRFMCYFHIICGHRFCSLGTFSAVMSAIWFVKVTCLRLEEESSEWNLAVVYVGGLIQRAIMFQSAFLFSPLCWSECHRNEDCWF